MQEPVFSYVPGVSFLHRLDPRTKIAAVMLLGILTFRVENFAGIAALFAFFFALASLSGLPMKIFFRAVRPMMLFIIFIFLAQLFFTDGKSLASYWILQPTLEGLETGLKLAARFVLLLLFAAFLPLLFERAERTKAAQAARGMDSVKNPLRSVPALAIPLLRGVIRDAEELALAMESRGYQGSRRTSMHELSMQKDDWKALSVLTVFFIFVLFL
jgi:energy-coupling factor transport system permease protein